MEIKLTLALPGDEFSVPIIRRVLAGALESLGVTDAVVGDIVLALTEACTNVLEHADHADDYEVSAGIDGDKCVLEVVDRGHGFDGSMRGLADADHTAEDGRGIQLMRALMDRVTFVSRPQQGTVVHLEKQLEYAAGSPLDKLTNGRPASTTGPWSDRDTMDDRPR